MQQETECLLTVVLLFRTAAVIGFNCYVLCFVHLFLNTTKRTSSTVYMMWKRLLKVNLQQSHYRTGQILMFAAGW